MRSCSCLNPVEKIALQSTATPLAAARASQGPPLALQYSKSRVVRNSSKEPESGPSPRKPKNLKELGQLY